MKTILVADDNKGFREGLCQALKESGYQITEASNGRDALKFLQADSADLLIADIKMPILDGMNLLKEVKNLEADTMVIIITAHGTIDLAVEAMKLGAYDFIEKPFRVADLEDKIKKAFEKQNLLREIKRLSQENEYLKGELKNQYNFEEIIGDCASMQRVYELTERVAQSSSTVLITGESGTGKELIARAIHYRSPRQEKPFVKVNCSVFSEGVLESELFGHERGAFSGAIKTRIGRFELADRGTILLDEVGDISLSTQLKLLRMLQEKEFERVGDNRTRKVDVRVIASTNKNLEEEIKKGSFREDLYYRLNVVPVFLPPLRERKEDIPKLVAHFLRKLQGGNEKKGCLKIKSVSEEAMKSLLEYPWPGNIRELENAIERALVLARDDKIEIWDLPLGRKSQSAYAKEKEESLTLRKEMEKYERDAIEKAFISSDRMINKTAKLLGIERNALRYKLRKYKLILIFLGLVCLAPFSFALASDSLSTLRKEMHKTTKALEAIEMEQKNLEEKSLIMAEKIDSLKNDDAKRDIFRDKKLSSSFTEFKDVGKKISELREEKKKLTEGHEKLARKFFKESESSLSVLSRKAEEELKRGNVSNAKRIIEEIIILSNEMDGIRYPTVRKNSKSGLFFDVKIEISDEPEDIIEKAEIMEDEIDRLMYQVHKTREELQRAGRLKDGKEKMLELLLSMVRIGDKSESLETDRISYFEAEIEELSANMKKIEKEIKEKEVLISSLRGKVKTFYAAVKKLQVEEKTENRKRANF